MAWLGADDNGGEAPLGAVTAREPQAQTLQDPLDSGKLGRSGSRTGSLTELGTPPYSTSPTKLGA